LTARTVHSDFPPLVERVRAAFSLSYCNLTDGIRAAFKGVDELLLLSSQRAELLACEPGTYGLVHTDLHFENVLITQQDGRRRPTAIDPMPHVGDRTFDAIDVALHRTSSYEELDKRIRSLTNSVTNLDAARLRSWCIACAPVLAISALRDNANLAAAHFQLSLGLHFP
jgi:streptomycin 6-kinase